MSATYHCTCSLCYDRSYYLNYRDVLYGRLDDLDRVYYSQSELRGIIDKLLLELRYSDRYIYDRPYVAFPQKYCCRDTQV